MKYNYFYILLLAGALSLTLQTNAKSRRNRGNSRPMNTMQQAPANVHDPVKELKAQGKDFVVMFYRPSCPFCTFMMPMFNQSQAQFGSNVPHVSVNIDSNANYFKSTYGFGTVPTIAYFKKGQPVMSHGSNNRTITAQNITNNISNLFDDIA